MTDIDGRLRSDAAAWQHGVDAQVSPLGARPDIAMHVSADRAPRRQVARWLIPAAAAFVVAAVVIGASQFRHPGSGRGAGVPANSPSATSRPALTSSTFDGFTFHHPGSWHSVQPEALAAGPSHVVGYLTDQPVVTQCSTSTSGAVTEMSCHGPVTRLRPGGVVVTLDELDLVVGKLTATETIAGQPATVIKGPVTAECVSGSTYQVQATVALARGGDFPPRLVITACASAPVTEQTRLDIDTMLGTAVYRNATVLSAATVTGRFVLRGGPAPGRTRAEVGTISFYASPARRGTPVKTIHTDANGYFTTSIAPGTYYLAGKSAQGTIASRGPTVASAGATTRTIVEFLVP